MGFFGRFVFSDGQWSDGDPDSPFLVISVEDSDIATVDYAAPIASGRFYLGYEPRHYYEDPAASQPVDVGAQVDGFAGWARQVVGVDIDRRKVRRLVASPKGAEPRAVFVETSVNRLLELAGLPLPEGLPVA